MKLFPKQCFNSSWSIGRNSVTYSPLGKDKIRAAREQEHNLKAMKYFFIIILFLGITSCEKESECCSYNYWTTYHNNSLNEECACCYDITGRIIECPN